METIQTKMSTSKQVARCVSDQRAFLTLLHNAYRSGDNKEVINIINLLTRNMKELAAITVS